MSIRTCAFLTLWVLAAVMTVHSSAARALPEEGTAYRKLEQPQPTASPGTIEVIEFFSYGCPHCSDFHPLLSAWAAKLPKDVVFRRVTVSFNRPAWINLARAYYALQACGDLDKLDGALFHAIHQERRQLFDEQSLADWVGKNGGNAEKFSAAYSAFGVNNQTVQADQTAESYRIEAIPTLAVNGRYIVLGGTFTEILANADKVIALARAEAAAGGTATKHK
ncbi:MAG TPA: thiol:disulfide interchange protein DsbA/DsbL [Steroidobacteraceae bacterium]